MIKSKNSIIGINTLHHELRTSLTIIFGAVNLLNEEPLTPKQKELIAHISVSAKNLLSVADALI